MSNIDSSPEPEINIKRQALPLRDDLGFRMKRQAVDKTSITAYEQLGADQYIDHTGTITKHKTISEEEAEGAKYILDGRLRRVAPYFFTYLTYCKLRWRDRKLLDVFVDEFRDRDAAFYKAAIGLGQVTLNKKPASLDLIVRNGDLISHRCHRHEPAVSSAAIKIVFEDDSIVAIDKPSGIPVHPTGRFRYNTITKIFQHEFGKVVHPCNRLDRLTSGLMFLGKTARGADQFVQQMRDGAVRKTYLARVIGEFPLNLKGAAQTESTDSDSISLADHEILVDQPLKTIFPKLGLNRVDPAGKPSQTIFKRISYDAVTNTSIVLARPLTGRTHQIRVHLQYLGHAIANDPIYSNELVWGPQLGRHGAGNNEEIIEKLDKIGKKRALSTWFHPQEDGEVLSGECCEVCDVDLYTDPGPNDLDLWLHAYKYEASDGSWKYETEYPEWALQPHRKFMELALEMANKCGETQTQFNVGAVIVNNGEVLSTGHSRELPGNTHAEQCALEKYYTKTGKREVPPGTEIYTTMEPCSLRLSGNLPCVDRILQTCIKTCFVGVVEPDIFVKDNTGFKKLTENNVEYIHIPGYEQKCLEIATKGHDKKEKEN